MIQIVGVGLQWFLLVFFGIQAIIFVGLVLWSIWTDCIKPRLTPRGEIDREAEAIIAGYADPECEAYARHERAWYRSEGPEQVYWYRVRKSVRRKLTSTGKLGQTRIRAKAPSQP